MRLIVHAGIHRTGTTSIQKCLERNRDLLAKRGVHYPASQGGRHRTFMKQAIDPATAKSAIATLIDEAPEGTETIVISNEDFSQQKNVAWLTEARERLDVDVVFYVIRQDRWIMSWYNQHVKSAWNAPISRMTPDAFLDEIDRFHWLDYAALTRRWSEPLAEGRLRLRVLEPGQVEDVTADFLEFAVGDTDGLDLRRPHLNRSLPGPVLEFTRLLNEMGFAKDQRPLILRALAQPTETYGRAQPIYPPAVRNDIIARFAETNAQVAKDLLGREDGRLFLDDRVAEDAPFEAPVLPPSEEFSRNIVGPFLRDVLAGK